MPARPYQTQFKRDIYAAWNDVPAVCAVLPTGGGKTYTLAEIANENQGGSCTFAHRHELVTQLSGALAGAGLRHKIIGSDEVVRACVQEHMATWGTSFYNPSAAAAVASVDTLTRAQGLESWAKTVTLATNDEGHHLVVGNKWSKAIGLFTHPSLRLLGPTASPHRADGKGLGRGHGGLYDTIVFGPNMRWLIDQGYLNNYDIACPTSDLVMLEEVGNSGDWTSKQMREAAERSHIVGDAVQKYQQLTPGRLGITFATDVQTAAEMANAFNAAGVPSAVLTGTTPGGLRRDMLKRFATRQILMLVAVDIVSEGFDLPALEVCIFARPTQSLALFLQQFGRVLRPLWPKGFDPGAATQAERLAVIAASIKPVALVIDLVGNVIRHKLPDIDRPWNLLGRKRGESMGGIPLRICSNLECKKPFERILIQCPHCGKMVPPPEPTERGLIQVDGDVEWMDPTLLAALRGEIETKHRSLDQVRHDMLAKFAKPEWIKSHVNNQAAFLDAQAAMMEVASLWGGTRVARGRMDREMQREFFHLFGVDVLTAQTLPPAEALALRDRIRNHLQ